MQRSVAPREDRLLAGIGLMALAVLFFTAIDTSAKWLNLAGLPVLQIVCVRYAGHFLLAALIFVPQEGVSAFRSNRPVLQGLRAAALLTSTSLNFIALKYLPITVTTTILFANPVIITVLSILFLGERVGLRRFVAVLTGFSGVLIVTQPWGAVWQPAMLLSLGALLCASSYFVLTRAIAGAENNSTSQLWSAGFPALVLFPLVLPGWEWPERPSDWTAFLAIGIFGGIGHIAAVIAHRFADASMLAPMNYSQIVFAPVAGVLFFATWPTVWTLVGGAVIAASGVYIAARERAVRRHAVRARPQR